MPICSRQLAPGIVGILPRTVTLLLGRRGPGMRRCSLDVAIGSQSRKGVDVDVPAQLGTAWSGAALHRESGWASRAHGTGDGA